MAAKSDNYPTRVDANAAILPRVDPVVYRGGATPAGILEQNDLDFYETNGYLFFERLFDEDEINAIQSDLEELRVSERIRQSEIGITEPTSGEVRSIFAVHTVSPVFSALASDSRLVGMARQILGSEVYLHQTRVNLKPGFRGKEFYWHSDFETWHAEDGMPAMRAVSCSIALTENYEFNGPLMLIPGSHKHYLQCTGRTPENHYKVSLKKQDYGVPNDEQLMWLTEQSGIEIPKGPAGSVILFDCNTMHGSNSNISPFPRSNAFFVFNSIENTLAEPFAAQTARPWFLGNREPVVLAPRDFRDATGLRETAHA